MVFHSGSGGGATASSGTPPLPLGASTSANQTSEIALLTSIAAGLTPASTSTPSAPALVNCNLTSATIISANANRASIVLTNVSNKTVSIAFGADAAVLGQGITLYPGWIFQMDSNSFTTLAINGIGAAASCNIAVQEFNKL